MEFAGRYPQAAVQQVIAFSDQLHVAILDAVMHHLDVVAGAARSHVLDAGLAIFRPGRDGAKDRGYSFPSRRLPSGHDGRPPERALFAAGDAGSDIEESLCFQCFVAAVGIEEGRIAAIHEDVARLKMWLEVVD